MMALVVAVHTNVMIFKCFKYVVSVEKIVCPIMTFHLLLSVALNVFGIVAAQNTGFHIAKVTLFCVLIRSAGGGVLLCNLTSVRPHGLLQSVVLCLLPQHTQHLIMS